MFEAKMQFPYEDTLYEIRRMEASDGSWLMGLVNKAKMNAMGEALKMMDKLSASAREAIGGASEDRPEPTVEQRVENAVSTTLDNLDQEQMRRVQILCLGLVSKQEEKTGAEFWVPCIHGGEIVDSMRYDGPAVYALTAQTMIFNLTPFFQAGGLAKIFKAQASSR
jgi:hypothetical protein